MKRCTRPSGVFVSDIKKSLLGGEFMKPCLTGTAEDICPEKINLLNTVILLARPVAPKFNDIWEPHQ